ncbi:2-phosphosulfolactate phosphatase [Streptomyces sp. ISL-43]|uniref:2-phosphosulfolactate phosphatase n=1 Tax=Streptomyces sp. ISL-43 TaxID=2819183 RepID=UPI001BE52A2D|nr:2-phosphosulfolactate phosphatase [Streptomyces sp. ISL-43]MBT2448879.1 2-phosphosulfolactate phosphatase [Streptomyces sp. ISL-43]
MDAWFLQTGSGARFDWGPVGAQRLATDVACLVVVDVLSFTTSVTVAVEGGARVFPHPWRDESAARFADEVGARLAVGRRAATSAAPWSLSPAALRDAPFVPRLVLPSPNGSSIAAAAGGSTVVAACLRNATAVADWLARHGYGTLDRPVAVIASGERWPDGGLRPALEDLLGAGAVLAALRKRRRGPLSPEASAAADCFEATPDVAAAVTGSASGRELTEGGFARDVAIATEPDSCDIVPVLTDGAFSAAG